MNDLRQLKHFIALAEHGSFARAALALHLSQPALSRSLQNLEASLGCRLIDRHTRRLGLTAQGLMLLEHARRLVAASQAMTRAVQQIDNLQAGQLCMGAGPYPAAGLVPQAVARLISDYPQLQVDVLVDDWRDLRQRLLREEIEIFVGDVRELLDDPALDIQRLPVCPVIAVCRPGHPLLQQHEVDFRHAAEWPLAGTHLPESVATEVRRDTGRDQALSIQCDNVAFLLQLVQHSDAICMAPSDILRQPLAEGLLCELKSLSARIRQHSAYGLVSRRGHSLSPAAAALCSRLPQPATGSIDSASRMLPVTP